MPFTLRRRSYILLVVVLVSAPAALLAAFGYAKSSPPALRYTALGDSITYGAGASQPSSSWVQRYRSDLEADRGRTVELTNLGRPGSTSFDLLRSLREDRTYGDAVASSDLITVAIGTNDFFFAKELYRQFARGVCGGTDNQDCLRGGVDRFIANYDAIVAELRELAGDRPVSIRLVNIYYPDAALNREEGLFATFNPYLDAMNAHIAQVAQEYSLPLAQVHRAFNDDDGTGDPLTKGYTRMPDVIHPADAGHAKIATLLEATDAVCEATPPCR